MGRSRQSPSRWGPDACCSRAPIAAPPELPWGEEWARAANADYRANLEPQALPGEIDMPAIVAVLQKHLPADAVVTNGAGNFASWMPRFFVHHGLAKGHNTQLAPTGGAMVYGVPAGIAAVHDRPIRPAPGPASAQPMRRWTCRGPGGADGHRRSSRTAAAMPSR